MASFKLALGLAVVSACASIYSYYGIVPGKEIIILNFEGSSSMKPVMEMLLREYNKNPDNKVSFNVSSIGSNSGLKKVMNSTSEFALVSHDVSNFSKLDENKKIWVDKKLKTIVLSQEAIVVLYKPPKDCDEELILNDKNIIPFYSLFSGHKHSQTEESLDFSSLLRNNKDNSKCKVKVAPWAKSTGPMKSGTAKAFVDNPLFKTSCNTKEGDNKKTCEDWMKKVVSGYGVDYEVNYVPESTNLHWHNFSNNLEYGSMTYLPSHFVLQNWNFIEKLGIKFAKYQKSNEESVFSLTKEGDIKNYEWKRPFNIIYSTNNLGKEVISFLKFLVKQPDSLTKFKLLPQKYYLKGETSPGDEYTEIDVESPDKFS